MCINESNININDIIISNIINDINEIININVCNEIVILMIMKYY